MDILFGILRGEVSGSNGVDKWILFIGSICCRIFQVMCPQTPWCCCLPITLRLFPKCLPLVHVSWRWCDFRLIVWCRRLWSCRSTIKFLLHIHLQIILVVMDLNQRCLVYMACRIISSWNLLRLLVGWRWCCRCGSRLCEVVALCHWLFNVYRSWSGTSLVQYGWNRGLLVLWMN